MSQNLFIDRDSVDSLSDSSSGKPGGCLTSFLANVIVSFLVFLGALGLGYPMSTALTVALGVLAVTLAIKIVVYLLRASFYVAAAMFGVFMAFLLINKSKR